MGLEDIDGWGLHWHMVLRLVGAIPIICEVEISSYFDSHFVLSSLGLLALALQHHSLPILDLVFARPEK